jgi:hypothetical protein
MQEYTDIISLAKAIHDGGEYLPDNADSGRVSEVASEIAARLFIEISEADDEGASEEEMSERLQSYVTDAIACGYIVAKLEDANNAPISPLDEEIIRKLLSEGTVTITLGIA